MYEFSNNFWTNVSDANIIIHQLENDKPKLVAFDTETTGLNEMKDIPFLFIIGWKLPDKSETKTFCLIENKNFKDGIQNIFDTLLKIKPMYIVGANIKYDFHVLINLGIKLNKEDIYLFEKNDIQFTDTQILARLVLPTRDTDQLGLKSLGAKLVDKNAKSFDSTLSIKQASLTKRIRTLFDAMVKPFGYSIAKIKKLIDSDLNFGDSIPKEILEKYLAWCEEYNVDKYTTKLNGYKLLWLENKQLVEEYACLDVILTLEIFYQLFMQGTTNNGNLKTYDGFEIFKKENKLIKIYLDQERIGLNVDLNYLQEKRKALSEKYMEYKYELYNTLGKELDEGQHVEIANHLIQNFNVDPNLFVIANSKKKTDKPSLDKQVLCKLIKLDNPVKKIATLISFLRHLQKFKSTYLDRILQRVLETNDKKFHPSNKQTGAVSGRISGDFQQMPRDALKLPDGQELVHIRKLFIPSNNGYSTLIFNDFDQMELRVQAHYTIEWKIPDDSLIRAFVPYKYVNRYDNKPFSLSENRDNVLDKDENGNSIWVDTVMYQPWIPTDPHGIHVKTTFNIDSTHPNWKKYRNIAKTMNFSCIYGAGLTTLLNNAMFEDFSQQDISAIYNSIQMNFPNVKLFRQIASDIVKKEKKIANMYGRVYSFIRDEYNNDESYKASNYLIQGSCADYVKNLLITIDDYLRTKKAKSRVLCTIHDEVVWELYDGEEYLLKDIKKIMEDESSWCHIPLTVGEDFTNTTWADKKDISLMKGDN